jgi:hypothetical protein
VKIFRLLILCAMVASAQEEALTNDAVAKMVKAGLGEGLIISMIQNQPGKYSLSPDDLVNLKRQGVSDKVLAAMLGKGSGSAAPVPASAPAVAATSDSDIPPGIEIGLYFKKAGKWEELLPEVVNWKTGGVVKSIATVGIVKGDVNGHIPGIHSRTSVASPLEFLIDAPEGVAITEYQLLRLREEKESREFRTVTGGVMHVSGGATRDVVPFEGKKIMSRIYKVVLPSLGPGEYGFLPPSTVNSTSSTSLGKMYTFRLLE